MEREQPTSKDQSVEFALRQGTRCRNYGPDYERTEYENVIVILADEVERQAEEMQKYKAWAASCDASDWQIITRERTADLGNADEKIERLQRELDRAHQIIAAAYQLAGVVGAPVRFLDALALHDDVDIEKLLPVSIEECEECRAPHEPRDEYQLPCDVHLPPNTFIGKGCLLSTLMAAFKLREGQNLEFSEKPRPSPPPCIDLATWSQALDIIGQLIEIDVDDEHCKQWKFEGRKFFEEHAPRLPEGSARTKEGDA